MIDSLYIYSLFDPEDLLVYPESRMFDFDKEFNILNIVDCLGIYLDLSDFTQVNSSLNCTEYTIYSDVNSTLELGTLYSIAKHIECSYISNYLALCIHHASTNLHCHIS